MHLCPIQEVIACREIREKILILEGEAPVNVRIAQKAPFVISDLVHGGFQRHASIPRPSASIVEAASRRSRMGEGGVDDLGLRYAVEQFPRPDCRIATTLGNFSLVGCSVEFAQINDGLRRQIQIFQYAFAGGVFCGNQPMRTRAMKFPEMRHLQPTPRRIEIAANLLQTGNTGPQNIFKRRLARKQERVVRLLYPLVGQVVRQKDVQRLVDSDDV